MSQTRYLKSMITPTLVEPTENHEAGAASGVWSTQDQLEARRGGVWPEAGVTDPNTLIENNFSTTLYTGNSSSQAIQSGIDFQTHGGMYWIKVRSQGGTGLIYDTERTNGRTKALFPINTDAENSGYSTSITSTNGFVIGSTTSGTINETNVTYASWNFKKAKKFFDVVTYTGTGSTQNVSHNLGSIPGMIIVRRYNAGNSDWGVYHRGANGGSNPENYRAGRLNETAASNDDDTYWNDTAPTASVFTVETSGSVNNDGDSYVAYLFAHETGDDSMIQCGYYEASETAEAVAAVGRVIDLGWEPQWLLVKNTTQSSPWSIIDSMRGVNAITDDNNVKRLAANIVNAEGEDPGIVFTSTGFYTFSNQDAYNSGSNKYIYVAIRRPNMATITDATKVYTPLAYSGSSGAQTVGSSSQNPLDMVLTMARNQSPDNFIMSRLTGPNQGLKPNVAEVATTVSAVQKFDQTFGQGLTDDALLNNRSGYTYSAHHFTRAKGYFDVVCYNGTGSARTVAHGLGVAPEMMWIKNRSVSDNWAVYYGDNTDYLILNTTAATADSANWWNDTSPTSSVFTVNTDHSVNENNKLYIAYLFATLAGVSKIGSVTHSGSSTDVDCGFSAGAKLVMLKRTDATGDWYWWDSVRGIIAGNDPYLLLNSTAEEVTNTDFIDPLASGFQISGDFTDGDYIFYAIA